MPGSHKSPQPTMISFYTNLPVSRFAPLFLTTSFVTYLYYKRFEPYKPSTLLALLLLPPAFLSPPLTPFFSSRIFAFALSLVIYNALILVYTAVYRLSPWHPLASYPGPTLGKLSKWHSAAICANGKQHLYYFGLHDRYGDYVRIGPNELSIRDASIIHSILGPGGLQKGPSWDHRPPTVVASRNAADHARKRKPWDRAFVGSAMSEYQVIIADRVRELVDCMDGIIRDAAREKRETQVDLCAWFDYFATDFMGDLAFGGVFDLMKHGRDTIGIRSLLQSGVKNLTTFSHVPWILPYLNRLPGSMHHVNRARKFANAKVFKRLQTGSKRRDLFYYLNGEDQEVGALPGQAESNGLLAIIAGSDTTSTTLAVLFYYLIQNPTALDRLRDEVEKEFPAGEEPLDAAKLCRMAWLNACINEALRLHPPVSSGSQRSVLRGAGPKVLGNHVIPEQTQLFLHTHSIQRDPRNFSMPDAFLPQRWIGTEAETTTSSPPLGITTHNPAAFIPFSYGPTACVGKNLALMEMRFVASHMVQLYEFRAASGYDMKEWEGTLRDWFVLQRGPLMVNVAPRGA
ncbi:high nitrogen upregulated cytochrome P450 monooxygenase 2 [Russula compacta]|nr:high nitrogen upregulated cytochrome P450 monooxygenase 2 [Russula compacta]